MKKLLAAIFISLLPLCSIRAQSYAVTDFIDSLDLPIAFDFAYDGRVFLTQKGTYNLPVANAQIKVYNSSGQFISVFYDLSDSVRTNGECGLIGLALDPDFQTNHFVYVYYNHFYGNYYAFRILRFTEQNNIGINPAIIFDYNMSPLTTIHVAGNLHFRPSDTQHIYFAIGELGDSLNAQRLDAPLGKILRIHKNGTIPTDNPFYDDGNPFAGNDDRIWSYGHRNPFDFCFSPENDSLYISENGRLAWDEVNIGSPGANYGWPFCEGAYFFNSTTIPCANPNYRDPLAGFSPTMGLTGITWYNHPAMPEFNHHLLVADFNHHNIYDMQLGNSPYYNQLVNRTTWMSNVAPQGISALHQGPDGCVYAAVLGFYPAGKIIRICHATGVEQYQQNFSGLAVHPVPSSGNATVTFTLRHSSFVQAEVLDVSGRKMATLAADQFDQGRHEISFSNENYKLTPGMYFIHFRSDKESALVKLILTEP